MKRKKKIWDDILTQRDRTVYKLAGFGKSTKLGHRPAVLVIDVTYEFIGDKPEPILESVKNFPLSCGEAGWKAAKNIQLLLDCARKETIPIIYSAPEFRPETVNIGATKRHRSKEESSTVIPEIKEIVKEIAPRNDEVVIYKQKASVFFGTPLISHLTRSAIDTLIVCGGSTSGCVRASVIDAFSYGFKVAIVEECTFDRGELSHKVNLFDIHQKYGNVMSIEEVLEYLQRI